MAYLPSQWLRYNTIIKTGFAGIPSSTQCSLLFYHFHHFGLMKKILLLFFNFLYRNCPWIFFFSVLSLSQTERHLIFFGARFFCRSSPVDETERRRKRSPGRRATSLPPAFPSSPSATTSCPAPLFVGR